MPPPPPTFTTSTPAPSTTTTTSSSATGRGRLASGGAALGNDAARAPSAARELEPVWRGHRSGQRKMCHCKTQKRRTMGLTATAWAYTSSEPSTWLSISKGNNENRLEPQQSVRPNCHRQPLSPSSSSSSSSSLPASAARTTATNATTITITTTTTTTTTEDVPTPSVASTRSSTAALAQRIPTMNEVWPCSSSSSFSSFSFPVQNSGLDQVLTASRVSACADMADAGGLCDRHAEPYYVTKPPIQITSASSESGCEGERQRKQKRKKKRRRGNVSGDPEKMNASGCTQLHPAFVDWDRDSTDRLTGKVSLAIQERVNNDNTPLTAPGRPMHADERLRVPPESSDNDSQEGNNRSNSSGASADGGCAYACWYPGTSKVTKVDKHARQVPCCWWLPWLWLRMWFTWWATWFRPAPSPSSHDNNNSQNQRKNSARSRGKWSSPAAKWIWLSLLLCSFVSFTQSQGVPEHGSDSNAAKGICSSMDIRNTPSNLEKLRNCRVIEGHLKFVLMEHVNASEFANYTFPELREITDYFMMYRVYGLKTLRHLFPNLAVIRGQSLFKNYAFVIFECNHLQDIALPSLTDISRGAVRVEKNPNLCYINTVDWLRIAQTSGDTNFFKDNKPVETCPTRTSCPQNCPTSNEPRSRHCWSNNICQKFCDCEKPTVCPLPANAISSTKSTKCCHPQCLGGCTGPESNQCIACRNVSYQNQCKELCPPDTYLFNERRCLTDSECINQEPPESNGEPMKPWIPFEGVCRRECPPGYQINETKSLNGAGLKVYSCVPCSGPCPKLCYGTSVDSIERAQALKGCTIITGALEIQVKGGENIVRELVENLSLIEEVQHYVKIVRSHPLVSLDFLKNLRRIGGEQLENHEYALVVLDNPNLQELWDWDRKGRNLTIEKGKLFFHFNPNLCYDKIVELQNITNKTDTDRRHISPTSNGDKAACKTDTLDLKMNIIAAEFAIVRWENYEKRMIDPRALLGYVISYIEAPEQNLTYYSGRDACGGDGWTVDDYSPTDEAGFHIDHFMPNLEPATQYAVFVQTFTVASVDEEGRRVGARSPIVYFTTKPSKPSIPVQLKAFSNSSSEIVVTWKEPVKPNGNVTHYVITARWVEDDRELVDQRNYCSEPFMPDTGKASKSQEGQDSRGVTISQPTNDDKGECCACAKPKPKPTDSEFERDSQITFEDYVHNTIYIRRPDYDATRRKRDTSLSLGKEFPETPTKETSIPTSNETSPPIQRDSRGRYITFHFNVANATTYILRSLRHFAEYTIEIVACHDLDPDQLAKEKRCSDKAITTARTAPSPYADDIHEGIKATVSNSTDQVKISWKEPDDPNGLIVNYHIEYRRVETDKLKKEVCVPRKDYIANGGGYVIASLAPGNYSAEIKATSLYGKSTRPSHVVYFQIPEPSSGMNPVFIGLTIGIVILIILMILGLGGWHYRKKMGIGEVTISRNPEYLPADGVYVQDEWEVPRDKVELLRELGQGSFGMVYEGVAKDIAPGKPIVRCAVKTVNKEASIRERIEFLNEASVMKAFNCNHVVRLLGVVSVGQPTLVVMELMANGDLKSYLRSHRPDNEDNILHKRLPPTLRSVLQMAIEIADGMSYLTAKKFVHRDLAARNCMVAEDLTVKVGDFGMTRDIYATDYYRKGGKGLLPVRWMSPESLKDGVFTSQSDVWSFGVVLWEMATLASQPYQGLANEQVLNYVMKGGVMEKPEGCPDRMFELMSSCWRFKASERPTFFEIVESLLSETKPTFEQVSFYFSKEGQDARKDQKELEEKHLRSSHSEDPSTPLLLTVAELGEREQVVEMEEEDEEDEDEDPEEGDAPEDDSDAGSHVRIMYPAGPVYVRALAGGPVGVIRDPSWDMQSHSNSRSDGSHSTGKTISSEGSKNSHNGSANGYVSGILQHRRNGPDCC